MYIKTKFQNMRTCFTGTTKAIIGLCYKPVSSYGLHMIFHEKSKNLQCYLEPEICTAYVIVDNDGYAIHPYTKKRTIQLVSKYLI